MDLIIELGIGVFLLAVGVVLGHFAPEWLDRLKQKPEPIDKTAKEIVEWYRSHANQIHADEQFKKTYAGKYLEVTGEISGIYPMSETEASIHLPYAACMIPIADGRMLVMGQVVTVVGRICWASCGDFLRLDSGCIKKVSHAPPGDK